jgi:hypothetical protein
MPFMIILAAYVLGLLYDIMQQEGKQALSFKRSSIIIITIAFAAVMYYTRGVPLLAALLPQFSPAFLYTLTVFLWNILLIMLAGFGSWLLNKRLNNSKRAICAAAFPLIIVLTLFNNYAFTSKTWHEWQAPLNSDSQKIRQTVLMPDDFDRIRCRQARLMIDMFPRKGRDYDFVVTVNGQQIKKYQGGVKARENKFDKKFGDLYKSFFFNAFRLAPEDLRQWYAIDLPLDLLKHRSVLIIECWLSSSGERGKNGVIVFGDYQTLPDKSLFEGPCIPRYDTDTSFCKVMPYLGDYRFEKITELSSKQTVSEFYNGSAWQRNDLSCSAGRQSGTYRIRIELTGIDGSQMIL